MDDDKDTDLYCSCQKPYVEGQFMIECNKCNEWFHGSCVGIEEYHSQDIDIYHCPKCQLVYGPLVLKKRRNVSKHNYKEIHEGTKQISAGTIMFIRQLKTRKFLNAEDVIVQFENGNRLTADYFQENGFDNPILVYEKSGLNLVVPPPNFTVYDVEKRVGSMFEVHVIDVARQEDLRMKMREWTEYFNSPVRGKVLNVISLEFSKTGLSDMVMAPEIVRNISWVENVWPKEPPEDSPHTMPVVAKYCLMSVKDCYTDFHVDFGGTSVWYHVVRGEKIFYLIEPSADNLKKYGQWVSSSDQAQVFFGEKVDKCYKLVIRQGNTFFLPTGWIHAVLSPKDTLVFGGNFLHSFNIGCQNQIYALEKALKTPLKFLFPNYETTNWYAARHILKKIKGIHAAGYRIPEFLVNGVEEMLKVLKLWTSKKDELVKYHKLQIPVEINAASLIKSLEKELKEDLKLGAGSDFPSGELPSPAIVSTASSKTVIRLKLPPVKETSHDTPETTETTGKITKLMKKKEKLKKKEKKLREELYPEVEKSCSDTEMSSGMDSSENIKEKRKRGRPRREDSKTTSKNNLLMKGKASYRSDIGSVKVKVSDGKISSPGMNVSSPDEADKFGMLYPTTTTTTTTSVDSDEASIRLKLSLPSTITATPNTQQSPIYSKKNYTSTLSAHGMKLNAPNPLVETTAKHTTCLDIKAEIEAAKKDIFDDTKTDDSKKFFFKPHKNEDDCTIKPVTFNLNKNFPTKMKPKDENEDNLHIDTSDSKQKIKPIATSPSSQSGSDYDPADDAYYEDAEFVYPRIDVTSELSGEDFSWRPGQRKKPKVGEKRKGSSGSLQSTISSSTFVDTLDPFFAPDDSLLSEENADHRQDSDESTDRSRLQFQVRSIKDKEKPKKGLATAKQRLGKLLKLDKTGSRYVR